MERARAIAPLAALGVLTVALSQRPAPLEAGRDPASAADQTAGPRTTAPAQGPEDPFDALDYLAESLGVDISPPGLKRMALRENRAVTDSKTLEARREEARIFTDDFKTLAKAQLKELAKDEPSFEVLVERFFALTTLDTTILRFKALRREAVRQHIKVSFLIATLPDPIDSFTGWQFDPMLDAITQGVAASDYVFESYHFPDSAPEHGEASAEVRGRAHEDEASVVIFRRHLERGKHTNGGGYETDEWERERLVLLIVHENPSAGVHARALINAIRVVAGWSGPTPDHEHSEIRILGPTFSGTADSLARELSQAARRLSLDEPGQVRLPLLERYAVRFVSGSATDETNKEIIEDALPPSEDGARKVTFHATVQPDSALVPKLLEEVVRAGWSLPIGVLFEGNTQYGRSLLPVLASATSPLDQKDVILLPFPMNVSHIRQVAPEEKPGLAEALKMPSKFRPLEMNQAGQPADQIPHLSPSTTASYVELTLSGMLATMRKEHVGTVALLATDPRDKLFLAQRIARDMPNVSIFTVESDSLYIHPDYSPHLQGALVASTYPLYSGNQRWSYGFKGGSERREFANGSSKGIFNATLVLLNYTVEGKALVGKHADGEGPPRLLEYSSPGDDCSNSKRCEPPVWISVIGRNGSWPVQAHRVASSNYVQPIEVDEKVEPQSLTTFPSPYSYAVFILLAGAAFVGWAGGRSAAWRAAPGLRSWFAALVGGDGPARGRGYLLVAGTSLLVLQAFLAAVYVARARLPLEWEWSWFASIAAAIVACLAVCALADLMRRIATRLLHHDRWTLAVNLNPRQLAGCVRLMVLTLCVWSADSLLWYAWTHAFEPRSAAVSFVARAIDFESGVSPTVPVLCLSLAFVIWSVAELARLRSPDVALEESAVQSLMQQTIGGSLHRLAPAWALLNRSTVAVPRALLVFVLFLGAGTCLFVFDPVVRPLVTVEGPWFGRFVSGAILTVQTMICLSLLQFVYLWWSLKHLLEQMSWHRPAPAYEKVPRVLYPPGLFPSIPRLMELQPLVTHWRCSLDRREQSDESRALNEAFKKELERGPSQLWSASDTWHSLLKASQPPSTDQPGPAPEAVAERELLMEMCAALVVRDALARLRHNLVFVIAGVVLVFLSHTLFPFQVDAQLAELGWVYVALAFGAILTVLTQMKRNEILRRLSSPDPTKHTGWDSAFVWRIAVFALVPLLTLFAAQFPDVGGVILRFLDPVRKALP